MFGLDPALGRGPLFGELLPALVRGRGRRRALRAVGAVRRRRCRFAPARASPTTTASARYLRPLRTRGAPGCGSRRECLAFANVPDDEALDALAEPPTAPSSPALEGGVPRDVGSRLGLRRRPRPLPPRAVRRRPGGAAQRRRRALPRAVARRERRGDGRGVRRVAARGSPCGGGDRAVAARPAPGRRLGRARPSRRAEGRLPPPAPRARAGRRVAAPTRASTASPSTSPTTAPSRSRATLRVALYRDGEQRVDEAREDLELVPRAPATRNVEDDARVASSTRPGRTGSARRRRTSSSRAWSERTACCPRLAASRGRPPGPSPRAASGSRQPRSAGGRHRELRASSGGSPTASASTRRGSSRTTMPSRSSPAGGRELVLRPRKGADRLRRRGGAHGAQPRRPGPRADRRRHGGMDRRPANASTTSPTTPDGTFGFFHPAGGGTAGGRRRRYWCNPVRLGGLLLVPQPPDVGAGAGRGTGIPRCASTCRPPATAAG